MSDSPAPIGSVGADHLVDSDPDVLEINFPTSDPLYRESLEYEQANADSKFT